MGKQSRDPNNRFKVKTDIRDVERSNRGKAVVDVEDGIGNPVECLV